MADHKALYWEYDAHEEQVNCYLCPQFCHIKEGHVGVCHVRKNRNNTLITENYGEVSSAALDPMEKKPLYHYKPGSRILSFGTFGCNMRCAFCQNYSISQKQPKTDFLSTDDALSLIQSVENNIGVAFTYNEPFIWYEYMYELSKKVKEDHPDTSVVIVTNGYVNEDPLNAILPYVDALNIDLKAFTESYYHKLCGASLEPVLKTIEIASKKSHVEVTTLMVTGENDSVKEIAEIAGFIAGIDKNIPLHLSRYFPNYKMDTEATDIGKIQEAKKKAEKVLNYVYTGNIPGTDDSTYCPRCHHLLIKRYQYKTECLIKEAVCPECGEKINLVL